MAQITLENVTLSRQNKTLLKDITWKVNKGEHWAILGLNGSGKTSLLKLITAEYWTSQGRLENINQAFYTLSMAKKS